MVLQIVSHRFKKKGIISLNQLVRLCPMFIKWEFCRWINICSNTNYFNDFQGEVINSLVYED